MQRYQIIIHKAEEGGYWAEVPALPGCFTQADTKAELLSNMKEAIELYLEDESLPADAVLNQRVQLAEVAV